MVFPSDIFDIMPLPALYEQLAEECVELAHASLKMARIIRGENPTPANMNDVLNNIAEELNDVQTVADVLGMDIDYDAMQSKLERWYKRLERM